MDIVDVGGPFVIYTADLVPFMPDYRRGWRHITCEAVRL